MHGDNVFPFNARSWVNLQTYTWDEWTGQFSVHIPKIPWMFATVMTSLALGASSELAEKIWLVSVYLFAGSSVFISIFILFDRRLGNPYNWKNLLVCSIPSLFMQLNPWTALEVIQHTWFVMSISAMTLLIAVLFKILREGPFIIGKRPRSTRLHFIVKFSLTTSVLVGLIATTPQFIIYAVLFIAAVLIYNFRSTMILKKELALTLFVAIIANAYWILPDLYYSLPAGETNALTTSQIETSPKVLSALSRNSQLMNIVNLNSNWDQDIPYSFGGNVLDFIWLLTGVFLIYFVMSLLLGEYRFLNGKEDMLIKIGDYLFFILVLLLGVFLAQSIQGPLSHIYPSLVKLPLGWMFRDPFKFVGLVVLAITFLLPYVINNLIKYQKKKFPYKVALLASLLFSIFFHNWIVFTGNFNNRFFSLLPPPDYKEDINYLNSLRNPGLVAWFPHWNGPYVWDPSHYWSGKDIGKVSTQNLVFVRNPNTAAVWDLIFNELATKPISDISLLLQALGIKYIVSHTDFLYDSANKKIRHIESGLSTSHDVVAVKQTNYTKIFENRKKADLFSVRSKNLLVYNADINKLATLPNIYNLSTTSVIFSNNTNIGIPVDYIYSGNINDTIKINPKPVQDQKQYATILGYDKFDPTRYIVKVSATGPFMLVFAESYDPLWHANIVNDSQGNGYRSLPLYHAVNGFWINKAGTYQIEITYKPQVWYFIGSILSILTITFLLGYMLLKKKSLSYVKA